MSKTVKTVTMQICVKFMKMQNRANPQKFIPIATYPDPGVNFFMVISHFLILRERLNKIQNFSYSCNKIKEKIASVSSTDTR